MRRSARCIEIAGSGGQVLLDRAALDGARRRCRSGARQCRGRSAARSRCASAAAWLIANVRSLRCRTSRRCRRAGRLPRRRRRGTADRQALQFPPRRDPLSRSRVRRCSRSSTADLQADLRRRRSRRISRSAPSIRPTTSAPRSMSTRCSASISRCWARPVPASRPRRADPAPDLRAGARGPYRDDRSARRIFRRVQGQRRDLQRRRTCRCPTG